MESSSPHRANPEINDEIASTPQNRTKKRRVSFATALHDIVATIPSIDEISREERRAVWWQHGHFEEFRRRAKISAYNARMDESVDQHAYMRAKDVALTATEEHLSNLPLLIQASGARGLEHWTTRLHYDTRRQQMKDSRRIVVEATTQDEQVIATTYQDATRASRILARWTGQLDEQQATTVQAPQPRKEIAGRTTVAGRGLPMVRRGRRGLPVATAATRQGRTGPARQRKVPVQHRGIA